MKPTPIEDIRKISKKTPLNELVEWFNEEISKAANQFKNEVEIDIGFDIEFLKDTDQITNRSVSGEKAYKLLPPLYKDAIKSFRSAGYVFLYEYQHWYVDEPYSERWEKKYILTIKW